MGNKGQWITPPQCHRIGARTSEAVFGKRVLEEHAQVVLSNAEAGQEFDAVVAEAITRIGTKYAVPVEPFADEVKASTRSYPVAYQPRLVVEQLALLVPHYPDFDASYVEAQVHRWQKLPDGMELLQVRPKFAALGRLHGVDDPFGVDYPHCVREALVVLKQVLEAAGRPFTNYIDGRLVPEHFRLLAELRERLAAYEATLPGDFVVTPMQSGLFLRGRSVRRGRWEIERATQLPLPSLSGTYHLLTHPERLADGSELMLDCPGDELRIGGGRGFVCAPYLDGYGGRVRLFDSRVAIARGDCAPASFVLPE